MSVRIRVYPQVGGFGGVGGLGGYGGAVSAQQYYGSKLSAQKQVSTLQLGYERALANERIERARMEERLKNPYLTTAGLGAFGGFPMMAGLGGVPLGAGVPITGGVPLGLGTQLPMLAGMGSGQTNVTNQTSAGAASQTVTNSNVNNVSSVVHPMVAGGWGGGFPPTPFGGGGFLSGLLGALI